MEQAAFQEAIASLRRMAGEMGLKYLDQYRLTGDEWSYHMAASYNQLADILRDAADDLKARVIT